MTEPNVFEAETAMTSTMTAQSYNYDTFHHEMMKRDMHYRGGPAPGSVAPEFDLPTVAGGTFKLSAHRGQRPVLIEFGSITCPMTAGARPGLLALFNEFKDRIAVVSVYVREAHPGQNYPNHRSAEQKMRQARTWVELDKVPWAVAVDTLEGETHGVYGPLPNSAYLIDRTGHVAFRAMWAGQEGLLRGRIEELLQREARGDGPVNLGQRENLVIPMIRGGTEIDHTLARAGEKAQEDFRREMGGMMYGVQKVMGKLQPFINPGNSA